jgi:hypothetical protein
MSGRRNNEEEDELPPTDDLDVDLNRPTDRDLGLEDEDPADRRRDPLRVP